MHGSLQKIGIDVLDVAGSRSRWEALQQDGAATPFQSFLWVSTLLDTIGRSESAESFVLIARDVGSGQDLALLPLVRRRLGPMRILELPDFGVSDYGEAIIGPELMASRDRLAQVWAAILRSLPKADVLRINKIPETINSRGSPLLSLERAWQKPTNSWHVNLPHEWSDYETGVVSGKVRGNLRRALKKLEASAPVVFVSVETPEMAEEVFTSLCAHRAARFARLGRQNILAGTAHRDFYWQLITRGYRSESVSLSAIKMGTDVVATLLGLRWRDGYFALIPTMADGKGSGLGKLMNWMQLKHMHARGCRRFDFTIGNEPYKRDFGARPTTLFETARPLNVRGYPLAWALRFRAGLRLPAVRSLRPAGPGARLAKVAKAGP